MGLLGKPTILGKPHKTTRKTSHSPSPPHAHVPQYCGQQAIDRETPPAGNNVSNGNKTLIRHFMKSTIPGSSLCKMSAQIGRFFGEETQFFNTHLEDPGIRSMGIG